MINTKIESSNRRHFIENLNLWQYEPEYLERYLVSDVDGAKIDNSHFHDEIWMQFNKS